VGDVITYTITVQNTGNITLIDIDVVDDLTGDEWFIASLAPGESITFTTTYTITQEDLDNESVVNTVTATGRNIDGEIVAEDSGENIVTPEELEPGLNITKTADTNTYTAVGDVITYTIVVENTGNVTITDIDVVDDLTGDEWFIASLAPGESITFTASYVITQEDIDAGSVLNTVTATGEDHEGETVSVSDDETVEVDPDTLSPELTVNKTADPLTFSQVGDVITYTIIVENTGNVTITDIDVVDELTGDEWFIASLAPGESITFTVTYVITQEDIDAGSVLNTVTAIGIDHDNDIVTGIDEEIIEVDPGALHPELTVTKTADPRIYDAAGDRITYTIVVENTGNVTITDIEVVDDLTGDSWFIDSLAPGESVTFTVTYTITQLDMNLGSVANIVTANGFDPWGNPVSDSAQEIVYVIRVPGGLTPDTDYDNRLVIEGLEKFPDNTLRIYNRWGTLVFEASPYQNDWDGVPNRGRVIPEADGRLPSGTYYYLLMLEQGREPLSGYIYLVK